MVRAPRGWGSRRLLESEGKSVVPCNHPPPVPGLDPSVPGHDAPHSCGAEPSSLYPVRPWRSAGEAKPNATRRKGELAGGCGRSPGRASLLVLVIPGSIESGLLPATPLCQPAFPLARGRRACASPDIRGCIFHCPPGRRAELQLTSAGKLIAGPAGSNMASWQSGVGNALTIAQPVVIPRILWMHATE